MNRRLPSLPAWAFAVVFLQSTVFAQEYCDRDGRYCGPPGDVCEPSEPRGGPERRPELPAVPKGAYVAPTRSGEIMGPSRSTGLRGATITFPELKIGLPSLGLPSLIRSRRGPEMRLDSSRAPYVPNPLYAQGLIARERELRDLQRARAARDMYDDECGDDRRGPPEEDTRCAPAPVPDGAGMKQYRQRLDHLARQQEDLQKSMDQLLVALQQIGGVRTAQRPPQPASAAPQTTGKLRPLQEGTNKLRPVQNTDKPRTVSTQQANVLRIAQQANVLRIRKSPDSEDAAERSETSSRDANRDVRPAAASQNEDLVSVVVPRKLYEEWCRQGGLCGQSSDPPIARLPSTADRPTD